MRHELKDVCVLYLHERAIGTQKPHTKTISVWTV